MPRQKTLFSAGNASYGTELWVTNGTAAGTSLVKDIFQGPYVPYTHGSGSAFPSILTSFATGKVLFDAKDGVHGMELWVTDGTPGGTSLLKDINLTPYTPPSAQFLGNSSASFPGPMFFLGNGQALFAATDGVNGDELWVTDGTSAGTSLFKDINPATYSAGPVGGSGSSYPFELTALGNGKIVFSAEDTLYASEIWVTDGTPNGTSLIKNTHGTGPARPT